MLPRRWLIFTAQFLVVAALWGFFLGVVLRHQLDGWFVAQAVGVGLVVALANMWRTNA